jgi:hypothetical protein
MIHDGLTTTAPEGAVNAMSAYQKLCGRLWPKGARPDIWAVVDGARDPQVWWSVRKSSLWNECLYAGSLSAELERAAPYLVQLEFDEPQTMRLLNRGWGKSWGILLRSGTSLKALRKHLRRFLLVSGPGGKSMLFRYYDPRVMRAFLPTCSATQLDELFGPVECIATEASRADRMIEFRLDPVRQRLERSDVAL